MAGSFGNAGFGNKFEYALKYVRGEREHMDRTVMRSGMSKDFSDYLQGTWRRMKSRVPDFAQTSTMTQMESRANSTQWNASEAATVESMNQGAV